MGRKVDQEKLLAKIAAITNSDVEELKKTRSLYSFDESVMEAQSVINFFYTRVQPREPKQRTGETKLAFAQRQVDYHKAYDEWRIRLCGGCKQPFAYAYHYEGVKFCSLDCLDGELRKIGLSVSYGRELSMRWGSHAPAIVPPSVLEIFATQSEVLSEICSDLVRSSHPTHPILLDEPLRMNDILS